MNAWLIESENGHFIGKSTVGTRTPHLGWVAGHENALRMARREDAEALEQICRAMGIGFHENAIGVNEHIWLDVNPEQHGEAVTPHG